MNGASCKAEAAPLWRLIADPAGAPVPADPQDLVPSARRLARLVGAALAEVVLRPAVARVGQPLLDQGEVRQSRLSARFVFAQQRRWISAVAEAGFETVCLKGFANAWTLYDDPVARLQGDLDLLVRRADLDRVVAFLAGHGFRFHRLAAPAWGAISDASFMPLVSADGCNIDLHIHPDCYPAWRSLTTERVFAAAQAVEADGLSFRAPMPEHAFVLCITNAAKDKFDVYSLLKVLDAIALVRRHPALDWDEIAVLARAGGFWRPARTFLALLAALGVPEACVPATFRAPPRGLGAGAFRRVVTDFLTLFPHRLPLLELMWRELVLAAEPAVALHNMGVRLRGLVRPASGLPPGVAPSLMLREDA